ncbi:hypothetical protein HK097_004325 [Rhizophlyctis rosea]|uniref:RRM domain-containing protein n=1 Tax=Rhizophlyctis rosea TaxID=64517 RepID=A0AAD5S2I1_9FUNG|nr:hypothetical protein HK097_004325 [Rhizophlyctis rosea]
MPWSSPMEVNQRRSAQGWSKSHQLAPEAVPAGGKRAPNSGHNVYVWGLSRNTKTEDLEREFGKYGKITQCVILYDKFTQVSRGFAFVDFENVTDAGKAIESLDGILKLDGKILNVRHVG